jgi:hypothetical protein
MEEPGNLEIENKSAAGRPSGGDSFLGTSTALEYGLKGWWTTEVYFDGQTTANQSSVFTGLRFENRFRLTRREHWINPVLYAEFEDINDANKSLLEVVGHDSQDDLAVTNSLARVHRDHEAELKLLLDSNFRGWNVSENLITEKNLGHEAWEFGYALGVSRPLALTASSHSCNFCRENFNLGAELYGGLGTYDSFGFADTSHYLAPLVAWTLVNGTTVKFSPGFGLTGSSMPVLFRFGISYELQQFGHRRK